MNANLFQHVSDAVADTSRVAIETPEGRRHTYEEVILESGRLANAILARGVVAGDRVAVQVEKSVEALILYLACLRAGAVYLPLNTAYTLAEMDYFLGDAEPKLVVCDPGKRDGIAGLAEGRGAAVDTLDRAGEGTIADVAAMQSHAFPTAVLEADDLAAILYTSGTTGRSKGAMLTHGNLVSNALTLRELWRFTSADVLIHALPIYHVHGLFVASNVAMMSDASMLFCPRFDAEEVLSLMGRATVMMGVPTFYTRLLQHRGLDREAARHMRLFVSGSAPLLAETHREWRERTGHAILERYGMTETGMNASNPYEGDRIAGTVGMPLPDVEIRVTDPETEEELAPGEVGMIEVRGHHHGRVQRLPEGDRDGDRPRAGRRGKRRDRRPASRFRGGRDRDRGAGARVQHRRGRRRGLAGRAVGEVQAAETGPLRRRPAPQRDGQGAEERPARAERGALLGRSRRVLTGLAAA